MTKTIDYTVIAKTVPEVSKRDGTLSSCSIGYSPELGFIRVYPIPVKGFKRWHTYRIKVERNKYDSRPESWKLSSPTRHDNFFGIEDEVLIVGKVKNTDEYIRKMARLVMPSLDCWNELRKSIAFLKVSQLNPSWEANERYIQSGQIGLFQDVQIDDCVNYTKDGKEKQSRLTFKDGDGVHDLQLNDWQYYEYQRRFGAKNEAFRHIKCTGENLLLLGNMHNYRSTWIVIAIFSLDSQLVENQKAALTLF